MNCPFCRHQTGHEAGCRMDGATKDELATIIYEQARRIETLETLIFNMYASQCLSREERELIEEIVERQIEGT